MNELERLETALRNAHAAGDVTAAQRFAQAIRELQTQAPDTSSAPNYDRAVANNGWRDVPPPEKTPAVAALPAPGKFGGSGEFTGEGAGREFGGPREAGRMLAAKRDPTGAIIQGAGSAMFGVGVPVAAVDEFVRSRTGDNKPRTWNESLEFARGLREGSAKEYPDEYAAGNVLGMLGSVKGAAAAGGAIISKAPAIVKTVFAYQNGQNISNLARLANLARLSATGAAAAGVTAGMQEGAKAVVPAAEAGAVLAPVAAGVVAGASGIARAAGARIDPSNAAIRILAKRLGESADAIATRYNEFVQTMGRKPRLIEIMQRNAAEEMGQISASKVGEGAGRVFREAEQAASDALPRELQSQVERGGRMLTVPEQTAELPPITAQARDLVNSRVRSTEIAQIGTGKPGEGGRRGRVMDAVMDRIGNQTVHLTEAMRDVVEHPDIQGVMPAPLRRRVNDAIANGMDLGSIDIPLRTWEMMRYEASKRAGAPGASQIYSQIRNRIRDYAGGQIPEYAAALKEFGRRSAGAEATTTAERAVTGSAREFADMLRSAGEGEHAVTARASTRVGVRNWLSNQLSGTSQQAERTMSRLARDNRLVANLRGTLSRDEATQLEALGEQYGLRLNIIEGVKTGQKVMTGDAARFADAVATARQVPGGNAGVRGGARAALSAKAGESPVSATTTAAAMAENPGLQDRITTALGAPEADRLRRVGATATRAQRNLASATPAGTDAQRRAQSQAQQIQEIIASGVLVAGKSSGAFKANIMNSATQRLRMSSGTAKRLAEFATDPHYADMAIARMRRAGISQSEILGWYRDAALAAGLTTGSSLGGP